MIDGGLIYELNGAAVPAPGIPCGVDSVEFDGSTTWLSRGAGLTGAADSKLITMSFWCNMDNFALDDRIVGCSGTVGVNGTGSHTRINWETGNLFRPEIVRDGGTSTILDLETTALTASVWNHIMFSVDLTSTTKRHMYVNGASSLTVLIYDNIANLDFTLADWSIGGNVAGANLLDGRIADLYFAPGQYIDLSVQGNREKFRLATGKPANLGADGSTPTGVAPLVYLHIDDGEAPANFAINRGTGGNFTVNGTLTTGATSPSD